MGESPQQSHGVGAGSCLKAASLFQRASLAVSVLCDCPEASLPLGSLVHESIPPWPCRWGCGFLLLQDTTQASAGDATG